MNEIENNQLNDDWINNFEKTEKIYKDFYKDDVYYTNTSIIYVNKSNDIEKIKQESFLMNTPNYITREEIIGMLKKNSIVNDKRYSLLSILKYNITIDPEDVSHYLSDKNDYLDIVKHIDTIKFEKTISMFQDLTELIIIFFEKSEDLSKKDAHNITKKIFLNSNNKRKTIKKQY